MAIYSLHATALPHSANALILTTVVYVRSDGCMWSFLPGVGPYFSWIQQVYLAEEFEGTA
jgi:hypothetical protein